MAKRRPRMIDVAEEAGVSIGTVSRVLNGDRTVRPARHEAVQAAIAKLSYRPDPIARALRSGSTRTIGLSVRTLRNYSVATFVETVLEAVAPEGYAVSVSDTVMRRRIEQTSVQDFLNRSFDGVIALSPYSLRTYVRAHEAGAHVLAVYSPAPGRRPPIDAIQLDYDTPATTLLDDLYRLGHRCVNFVAPAAAYRLNPLAHVPLVAGGSIAVRMVADQAPDDEPELALIRHVLQGGATALLLRTESAPVILEAIRNAGLRVPDDLSVALWGHAPWRELVEPRLTAVEIDHRAVGAAAAARLLGRLQRRALEPVPPFVGRYLVAGSVGPPSAATHALGTAAPA